MMLIFCMKNGLCIESLQAPSFINVVNFLFLLLCFVIKNTLGLILRLVKFSCSAVWGGGAMICGIGGVVLCGAMVLCCGAVVLCRVL